MDSDYFGLATDTNIVLVSASKVPKAFETADAQDSNADIAARTYYGTKGSSGDTAYELTCEYAVKCGSIKLSTLDTLGVHATGVVLRGLSGSTSNGDWPTITATGRNAMGSWTLPPITINGRKKAQALGFAVDTGTRLTGSGWEMTLDENSVMDSVGEEAAYAISGGVFGVTADIVAVTAAPGWSMDTSIGDTADSYTETLTITQNPGDNEGNTEYATGSGSAEIVISRT
jgi:hypothetical protein